MESHSGQTEALWTVSNEYIMRSFQNIGSGTAELGMHTFKHALYLTPKD